MNTVKCPGCLQSFDQGISIKTHQRSCIALRLAGQQRIKKRIQNAQMREAVKRARIEGRSVDDIVEESQELQEDLNDNLNIAPRNPSPEDLAGPSMVSINNSSLRKQTMDDILVVGHQELRNELSDNIAQHHDTQARPSDDTEMLRIVSKKDWKDYQDSHHMILITRKFQKYLQFIALAGLHEQSACQNDTVMSCPLHHHRF